MYAHFILTIANIPWQSLRSKFSPFIKTQGVVPTAQPHCFLFIMGWVLLSIYDCVKIFCYFYPRIQLHTL